MRPDAHLVSRDRQDEEEEDAEVVLSLASDGTAVRGGMAGRDRERERERERQGRCQRRCERCRYLPHNPQPESVTDATEGNVKRSCWETT